MEIYALGEKEKAVSGRISAIHEDTLSASDSFKYSLNGSCSISTTFLNSFIVDYFRSSPSAADENLLRVSISAFSSSFVGQSIICIWTQRAVHCQHNRIAGDASSVSAHRTMPIVGLSPSLCFNSSYIRIYISICPTS